MVFVTRKQVLILESKRKEKYEKKDTQSSFLNLIIVCSTDINNFAKKTKTNKNNLPATKLYMYPLKSLVLPGGAYTFNPHTGRQK